MDEYKFRISSNPDEESWTKNGEDIARWATSIVIKQIGPKDIPTLELTYGMVKPSEIAILDPEVKASFVCPICAFKGNQSDWSGHQERRNQIITDWINENPEEFAKVLRVIKGGE